MGQRALGWTLPMRALPAAVPGVRRAGARGVGEQDWSEGHAGNKRTDLTALCKTKPSVLLFFLDTRAK